MRNQPNNTSDIEQRYDHGSEANRGQIHNVVIGFAPALCRQSFRQFSGRCQGRVLSHLNGQLNGKGHAVVILIPFSTGVMVITAGSPPLAERCQ
jgi:hypothetical protein